eukprot:scaffold215118_cov47-Prasinocladus_malaysianus.AAC.2
MHVPSDGNRHMELPVDHIASHFVAYICADRPCGLKSFSTGLIVCTPPAAQPAMADFNGISP